MPRTPDEATKRARILVFRPIAEKLAMGGASQAWLAQQMGLPRQRVWNYLNGFDRVPPDFIDRACRALGMPPSSITIPEPRGLYIQQPRTKQSTQSTPTTSAAKPASRAKGQQTHERSRRNGHDGNSNNSGNGGNGHGGATQRPQQPRRLRRAERTQTPDYTAAF